VIDLGQGRCWKRSRMGFGSVDGTATFLSRRPIRYLSSSAGDGQEKAGVLGCPKSELWRASFANRS